ncbi:MAG: hypothetical protein ACH346_08440 [Chthoniobacterales bacterium]
MNDARKLFIKIDKLIDVWCERRCLKPLAYLLPCYSLCEELKEQWQELLEALEEIKNMHSHELTADERKIVKELICSVGKKPWSFF